MASVFASCAVDPWSAQNKDGCHTLQCMLDHISGYNCDVYMLSGSGCGNVL